MIKFKIIFLLTLAFNACVYSQFHSHNPLQDENNDNSTIGLIQVQSKTSSMGTTAMRLVQPQNKIVYVRADGFDQKSSGSDDHIIEEWDADLDYKDIDWDLSEGLSATGMEANVYLFQVSQNFKRNKFQLNYVNSRKLFFFSFNQFLFERVDSIVLIKLKRMI